MKIYDIHDAEGRVFAFEVKNFGRSRVAKFVSSISGAKVTREPMVLSSFREDEFCEFTVNGQLFVAWEPYGDNSRYWIGPRPPKWCEEVLLVRHAFAGHKPGLFSIFD
jgi:hypothetical protein